MANKIEFSGNSFNFEFQKRVLQLFSVRVNFGLMLDQLFKQTPSAAKQLP